MRPEHHLCFPPFRLDLVNERLWWEAQEIPLRKKTFAVLRYLVEHPDQLVTKEALLDAVWAGTYVSDVAPGVCIQELRRALGEDRKTPQFIVTVHRRGYRFIAPLTTASPASSSNFQVPSSNTQPSGLSPQDSVLVGRETELAQLHRWLEKALGGERQIVFVTGEPGIGKTSLVEAFLARLASRPEPAHEHEHAHELWLGRGQCIEHYGAGEAYMPVLEALGRLCREPDDERLIELLSQHAPTWLVQMPALLTPADLEMLQRKTLGATRERMLREMAEAVEALTAERPLVLWLEDLQWSDYSTLELIAALARRRERARLFVVGTYRPVDVIVREHPLKTVKQELQLHGCCAELPLACLAEAAVAEYLTVRFSVPSLLVGEAYPEPSRRSQDGGAPCQEHDRRPPHPDPLPRGERGVALPASLHRLATLIHQRTDGNPLFLVTVVDDVMARGLIVPVEEGWVLQGGFEEAVVGVPENLRQLIEKQIERLSPEEHRVLQVGSVVGAEFSAAAVAAGTEMAIEEVEACCAELARHEQFLRASGMAEWPDGTIAARSSFRHALYQEVVYERIPARRRTRLHQQVGEREEQAYGERAREIAAELALHFERGRDYRRAVHYLEHAGKNAIRRSAHQEAVTLLTKGLELLKTLPDTPERTQQELRLQIRLGWALMVTKGYAAPEAEKAFARALGLCRQAGEPPLLFSVMAGLTGFYVVRGELQTARELTEQCLRLAQSVRDRRFLQVAHHELGETLLDLGELTSAQAHLEQGIALYDPQQGRSLASRGGNNPGVNCLSVAAWALWLRGYPDQALKRSQEALTLAQELSHPFSLAYALVGAAMVHQFRQEEQVAREQAEALITLSNEHGFVLRLADGTILRGWALAEQGQGGEGIAQMRKGLVAHRVTGAEIVRPFYLALLAEAYGKAGQAEQGLTALVEALAVVDKTGERWHEAELYRLKGELLLNAEGRTRNDERNAKNKGRQSSSIPHSSFLIHRSAEAEAEACFHKAIEIARKQQAKSLELRAVMSLSRLWQNHGRKKQARKMLAEIYGWFTEGFDTADLKDAKALLQELS